MAKTKAAKQNRQGGINYPLGDFLIRIKNAMLARQKEVKVSSSKLVVAVAKAMKKQGFLDSVEEKKGVLKVSLTYRKKVPVILDLRLISKPGLRVYKGVDELEKERGASIFFLSTPKGIMISTEAIRKRLGGEVIVEVW
jgi:small subunit ribosomal protein S8